MSGEPRLLAQLHSDSQPRQVRNASQWRTPPKIMCHGESDAVNDAVSGMIALYV